MIILLDHGHGKDTIGKYSPRVEGTGISGVAVENGRFREYRYNRIITNDVCDILKSYGYDARIVAPEDKDIPLKERVNRINKVCGTHGSGNVVMVSIHVNAHGDGEKWTDARGWSVWTTKGQNNSDKLADMIYDRAKKNLKDTEVTFREDKSDGDPDWESNFYIIKNSNCPCCLTENLFMTNQKDVKFLLSDVGMHKITRLHVEGIIDWIAYKTGKQQ